MPFMGAGSVHSGSEYGGDAMAMAPPMMPNTASMYGMGMPMDPRNTMMTNLNMFAGGANGSQSGYAGPTPSIPPLGMQQRPMSQFSLATSVNPFAGPNMNPNPSDDELVTALRAYLSTQDLMTVTKKTTREAIATRFPKADLASRKEFLNQSIDKILSES